MHLIRYVSGLLSVSLIARLIPKTADHVDRLPPCLFPIVSRLLKDILLGIKVFRSERVI